MPNSGTADLQPRTTLKGGHGKLEPWVGVSSHTALAEGSDLPGHSVCDPAAITAAWGPEEMGVWLSPAHGRCSGKVRCTQLRLPKHKGAGPTRTLALALKLTLREEKQGNGRDVTVTTGSARCQGHPDPTAGGSLTKH